VSGTVSYLDRIAACRAWNPDAFRPFVIDGRQMGRVRHDWARRFADFTGVFEVGERAVVLNPALTDFEHRTRAVEEVLVRLGEAGEFRSLRGEYFPVLHDWHEEPVMKVDRAGVPLLGVRGFGVHMNGYVVDADGGIRMWVGKRARDKRTEPGKFDHLVAGGQPHGLSLRENLIKEAEEEASIPRPLAERARPVGALIYVLEREQGLRDDVLFLYDLELPADFVPVNQDGEVEFFELWPIADVMARVRDTDDFKFNVALVNIDFFLRHGLLDPDAPGYLQIVEGLYAGDRL
jgi:8-oxo-dGTP pyrophosphatase MutT (NUDIX family)